MTNIADVATPATQTPLGLFAILILGLGLAFMAWDSKNEINLFFFRASRGNTNFGNFMAIAFPLGIVITTLWFVVGPFIHA